LTKEGIVVKKHILKYNFADYKLRCVLLALQMNDNLLSSTSDIKS
jgi:hypothetical protein